MKKEALQAICSCGETGYIKVIDILEECFTKCPKCGKKIFFLNCQECETGFSYPEGNKELDMNNLSWKCAICKKTNFLTQRALNEFTSFYKGGMPPQEKFTREDRIEFFRYVLKLEKAEIIEDFFDVTYEKNKSIGTLIFTSSRLFFLPGKKNIFSLGYDNIKEIRRYNKLFFFRTGIMIIMKDDSLHRFASFSREKIFYALSKHVSPSK